MKLVIICWNSWFVETHADLCSKITRNPLKFRKKFGCMGFFSYLCTVQWNEGLAKAPHFILKRGSADESDLSGKAKDI